VVAPPEEYLELAYNFRMTDLQAAVGLVQLGKLAEVVERRRTLAAGYGKAIADIPGLRAVEDPAHGTTNFQSYWVEVLPDYPTDREGLLARLGEAGVSARRGIMASHRQPAYRDQDHAPLPVTERLTDHTLILPLFHQLSDSEQSRVVDVLARR
jgi:dTDP-4-amino-4,6-dideoxygalactose transaminase